MDKPNESPTRAVFDHHCRVMSDDPEHPRRWRLTPDIAKKIRIRLKTYTVGELHQAATNLSMSPWHRGENPEGTEYCDPDFLYRTDRQVDKWLNKKQNIGPNVLEYKKQWTPNV